ncbi:MAG: hypothetical protein ACOCYD_00795 [bacterium]
MTLIRIIGTFLIIYLVFRILAMYVFPLLVRWFINKQKKKFYEQNPHMRPPETEEKSKGGVKFSRAGNAATDSKSTDQIGEYVDFEDIKEDKEKEKKKS